jgi:GrpB-like predicted nucleotidyltransferase (UPF0157 family)
VTTGSYHIVDHDPTWQDKFSLEQDQIVLKLGLDRAWVQHVGSTAVPGLGAKPIIDIMLGLGHHPSDRSTIALLEKLSILGYEHDGTETVPGTLYCRKAEPFRANLHVTEYQKEFWVEHLAFRDYLKDHIETLRDYESLKRGILVRMGSEIDPKNYNDSKAEFIQAAIKKALAEGYPRQP